MDDINFGGVYVWVLYCLGVFKYGFCNVWVCVYMGFVMCVFMYGFCNVWLYVCMGL